MFENFISRSDLGWGRSPAAGATIRSGLVIHYDSGNLNLANRPHTDCITYWRNTRSFHMGPQRGWADIGYSFMACPHDYVIEGRGLNKQQAAQPGGNATHYSVTLATGPAEDIAPGAINAVRRLRQWLMASPRNNHGRVLGHRDFIATSCPGNRAYALVQDGTFTKAPGTVGVTNPEDAVLGTREGDGLLPGPASEAVKAVQRLIVAAGFGDELGDSGVDGRWGPATSAGLLAARRYVGSNLDSVKTMTGESYAQLIRACARREAERAVSRLGTGGGEGGTLPTTERVTLEGTVTLKR